MTTKVLPEGAENIRLQFKPKRIKTLFVGESPPFSGSFFYKGSTQMARYMSQAFGNPEGFLDWFKGQGFYLDDLVLEPINHKTRSQRQMRYRIAVPRMAGRLKLYAPEAVVVVLKRIAPFVQQAMIEAGLDVPTYTVPFPGNGQQQRFLSEMARIMPNLPRHDRTI